MKLTIPQWRHEPTCAGLWVRRQWWGDTGEPYDQDALFELADRGSGYLEIASRHGKFYPLDRGGVSVSMWFGPIPKCPVERVTNRNMEIS